MEADGKTVTATTKKREEIEREAEENRKEALLASTQSLQPNFNRSNITQKQISKLQELHKRRMKIKANSKILKKPKGKQQKSRAVEDGESSKVSKESTSSSTTSLEHQPVVAAAPMKPQKLYWGLDTKERWERKANM